MKKILSGLLLLVTALVSCTDREEIEIAYQTTMTITASHLFDSYSTVTGDEFTMKGTENGDWDVNLHAFIYNKSGKCVKTVEEQYPSLSGTLTFDLDLLPGKYSVVAIAEFTGTFAGQDYKFWNISNTQNLNDLHIEESGIICNSPFETLGITTAEFKIGNRVENITVDIKPVTGLMQVLIWDDDFTGIGKDGFSFYAPYINDLTIYAQDLKQVVRFDGINPVYDYGDQAVRYPIQTHSPRAQYNNKGPKQILGFRALLPQEKRDFYWELNCIPGTGEYLFTNGKDWQMSDLTPPIDIQAGKQYVMDLILDQTFLNVQDYDPNVDMYERLEVIFDSINVILIRNALAEQYDKYVGMSKSVIETYLDKEPLYTTENTASYYLGEGLISTLTARFTDSSMAQANRIMLTWNISNTKNFETVTKVLSEMYTPLDNGTTENVKQFINGATLEEATVGISWDMHNYCLYFDAITKK